MIDRFYKWVEAISGLWKIETFRQIELCPVDWSIDRSADIAPTDLRAHGFMRTMRRLKADIQIA